MNSISKSRYISSRRISNTFLRFALGLSFLSAVADRFGIWGPPGTPNVAWGSFASFLEYTGLLLPGFPPALVSASGWVATIAEIVLAIGLFSGYAVRWFALGSGLLLLIFALSMTLALGIQPAFTYSVWTAAAASFLLAFLNDLDSNNRRL
jgi:uncharacterized membrane protein YphA (DoxX/SURF4 family)